jgi:tetratricopeptide (TPR) repeat protein
VFIKAEQYEDALEDCKRAVDLDPLCAHAWSRKGLAHGGLFFVRFFKYIYFFLKMFLLYIGLAEFELAFNCFNRCAEINPNHPELKERARVEKMKKTRDKQLERDSSVQTGFSRVKVQPKGV